MQCISPSEEVRSTGLKRPGRSSMMSTSPAVSSALKSCPRAKPPLRPAVEIGTVTCYDAGMAPTPKKSKPRTPQQRLRFQGLRPVQHWVPDLRDAKVLADLRKQAKRMAQHPENGAIDAWIESIYDWEAWK